VNGAGEESRAVGKEVWCCEDEDEEGEGKALEEDESDDCWREKLEAVVENGRKGSVDPTGLARPPWPPWPPLATLGSYGIGAASPMDVAFASLGKTGVELPESTASLSLTTASMTGSSTPPVLSAGEGGAGRSSCTTTALPFISSSPLPKSWYQNCTSLGFGNKTPISASLSLLSLSSSSGLNASFKNPFFCSSELTQSQMLTVLSIGIFWCLGPNSAIRRSRSELKMNVPNWQE
jgi:hypothetical protein